MNLGGVALHLFDDSGEFGQKFVVGVQDEQVVLSEQEAQTVTFCPAQTVSWWGGHAGDTMLDINHGVQLAWNHKPVEKKTTKIQYLFHRCL